MTQIKTEIRRFFIIDVLLDCKKWSTQDLMQKVNELLNEFFESNELEKPQDIELDDAKISPLLNKLEDEKLIKSKPIGKSEKKGKRGAKGYRYHIVQNIDNYFEILKLYVPPKVFFPDNDNREISIFYGEKFIKSPFGKAFLNDSLFTYFESQAELSLDIDIKNYILQIVKLSPNALKILHHYPLYYIPPLKEINLKSVNGPIPYYKKGITHLNFLIIKKFLLALTNSFIGDISHPSVSFPFYGTSIELKNVLFLKGELKNDNYRIQLDFNEFHKEIKIDRFEIKEFEKLMKDS